MLAADPDGSKPASMEPDSKSATVKSQGRKKKKVPRGVMEQEQSVAAKGTQLCRS